MPTWKKVVVSGSAISQLSNDANYLASLGDGIISSSAQLAADISGSFTSTSSSLATRITAQETFSSSLDASFASQAEIDAAEARIQSLETETGSIATEQSVQDARLDAIQTKTGSLETEQSTQNARLDALQTKTGSLETTNTTQNTRLGTIEAATSSYALAANISGSFTAASASLATRITGNDTDITALQTDSGSFSTRISTIEGDNATQTELDAVSSSLASTIDGLSSTLSISGSTGNDTVNLVNDDLSVVGTANEIETTVTNNQIAIGIVTNPTLTGNVTVTGNLEVSGTTTTVDSTTVNFADNIIALNGTGAANGGIEVNDANGPASGSLLWDGANNKWIAGAQGSEVDVALLKGQGLLSGSAQIAADISGSFVSASDSLNTRIDNITSTFDIAADSGTNDTVTTGETLTFTGNSVVTTTVSDNTITFGTNADIVSSSAQLAADISGSFTAASSSLATRITAQETFSSSLDASFASQAEIDAAEARIQSLETETGSIATEQATQDARLDAIQTKTGSLETEQSTQNARLDSLQTKTGSLETTNTTQDARLDALQTKTGSLETTNTTQDARLDALQTKTGSIETVNTTQNTRLDSIEAATSSYALSSGDNLVSASAFSSPSQGTVRATINGNNTDVDTGLQTGDSPTFASLTLTGDLTVSGTTTTVNSTTVEIGDNIIALNGTAATLGGIHVNDGPASGSLIWDGANDKWIAGASGSEVDVALLKTHGLLSGSAQIAADISGSSTALSSSLASRIDNITSTFDIAADTGTTDTVTTGETLTFTGNSVVTTTVSDNTITFGTNADIVSSSAQLASDISGSFTAASASFSTRVSTNETTNTTQNSRLDAIQTKTGSLETTNTTQNARLDALQTKTGSLETDITNIQTVNTTQNSRLDALQTESGSVSTRVSTLEGKTLVSASAFSSPNQGTVRATINGVNTDVDTGLQAGDSPTFADLTLTGNLTVTGDRIEQQVTNLAVEDQFITINSGASAQDAGIFFEGQGASLGWDESENRFALDFTGGAANQTTITSDAYIAAVANDIADVNYQKDGNIFVSGSGEAFIYVT